MRYRPASYLFFLLLPSIAACTGMLAEDGISVVGPVAVKREQPAQPTIVPAASTHKVAPPSGLTPDLVYAVLAAQVANQRDEHREAFRHYLHAARLAQEPALVELAAREALELGDTAAIKRAAGAWLDLAPDSIGAHQLAAYAHLDADNVTAATKHLRQIIELSQKEGVDGYGQAARLVARLKAADRRLKLMESLTAEDPKSADAWFARAVVAAGAKRQDEAIAAAKRSSSLRPDWNQPRMFLVQLYLNLGDRKKARETLEAFVKENPSDYSLRLLYAQLLVDEQEFSRARNVFEHLLRNTPKEPDVLFALGVLSLQLEDVNAARNYFTKLNDTGERRSDAVFYLGQVEEVAENPQKALSWYRKVEGENALDAQVRIVQIQAGQGKVERAREILQQLRDQWPDEAPMLYLVEGAILTDLDLPNDAMAVYDEALDAFPEHADLLYARALHSVSLNRLDIMERDLKAILADEPENADALNALGYSLADQTNRYAEALSYIERALALKPDDPAILDSMGWVHFRLGDTQKAITYLRKALDKMPDGEIAAHLGEVLWSTGRHDEAREVWREALAEFPDHEYLLRVVGRHTMTHSGSKP